MVHLLRALVAAAIIVAAVPAVAQEARPVRAPDRREVRTIAMGGYSGYGLYAGYVGTNPRYYYPRRGIFAPLVRPRSLWVVEEFVEEGRPLGLDPNAYGDKAYSTPGYSGWPYYYEAGRDEKPSDPPTPKAASEDSIGRGRGLWRAGDYAGALAAFKQAVADDLESPDARIHMALALLVAGDLKNADKALASALDLERAGDDISGIAFEDLFAKPKERQKFEAKLVPAKDGSGSITVALAQYLVGLKAKAAATIDGSKDPAAKRLNEILTQLNSN